jgi:hypothetical protein
LGIMKDAGVDWKGRLPGEIRRDLASLFDALPLARAMADLLPKGPQPAPAIEAARAAIDAPSLRGRPALEAGLWLYVDELERSHRVSQSMPGPTGAFWHAIMHRREGDFSNSKYWLRAAGAHPAGRLLPGHDPAAFVDLVRDASGNPGHLVETQRREWAALFTWCAQNLDDSV